MIQLKSDFEPGIYWKKGCKQFPFVKNRKKWFAVSVFFPFIIQLIGCVNLNHGEANTPSIEGSWISNEIHVTKTCKGENSSGKGFYMCSFSSSSAILIYSDSSGTECGNTFDVWNLQNDTLIMGNTKFVTVSSVRIPAYLTDSSLILQIESNNILFHRM